MIAFLAKNPLAGGLGIASVVLAILLGVQTVRLAVSEKETAAAELRHANFKTELATESLRVEREAKARSDAGIRELAEEVRSVGLVATQAKTEIRLVQSNGGPCRADPAWLAAVNGVRNTLAAGSPGGAAGQARP